MPNNLAIKVENLSKAYQIGEFSTGTVSRDIERWWLTKIRGKEDPFLKIGETNDRSKKGSSNIVWSLKDINFEIQQGDAVGIIGKNGAGKSTLLKLLSRVTAPTSGNIKVKGRIASLLEVGTGFHPELTGKENIFLNGAILGMRKHEIKRKLDEIIDFSGVERYIDTPVKRYSSGMYVRLAFAVAAHLESEILIVDEVLAVGDAEFQNKCLGKMGEISSNQGRSVLFVSHNLPSIKALCPKSILIADGKLVSFENTNEILNLYNEKGKSNKHEIVFSSISKFKNHYLSLVSVTLSDKYYNVLEHISTDDNIFVSFKFKLLAKKFFLGITLILKDDLDRIVFSSISNFSNNNNIFVDNEDEIHIVCEIPGKFLNDDYYKIDLITFQKNFSEPSHFQSILSFKLENGISARGSFLGKIEGAVRPEFIWRIV